MDIAVLNLEIRTRQAQRQVEKLQQQLEGLGKAGDATAERLKTLGSQIGAGMSAGARETSASIRRASDVMEATLEGQVRLAKATQQQLTSLLREQLNRRLINEKQYHSAVAKAEQDAIRASIALNDYRIERQRKGLEKLAAAGKSTSQAAQAAEANLVRLISEGQALQTLLSGAQTRSDLIESGVTFANKRIPATPLPPRTTPDERRSALLEASLKGELRILQDAAKEQIRIDRQLYREKQITQEEFYDRKFGHLKAVLQKELELLEAQRRKEERILGRTRPDSPENLRATTRISAINARQAVVRDQIERLPQTILEGVERPTSAISNLNRGIAQLRNSLVSLFIAKQIFADLTAGIRRMIGVGLEFNATIELSRIGIAGLIASAGALKDVTGFPLEGVQAFNAALPVAQKQIEELRRAGLQTTATTRELIVAYQQSVAAGTRAGLTLDQIRKFTVDAVQAARSLGLPTNQLAQEVRSILEGTIDRNSRVAIALGITNENIERAKEMGQLAEFLNRRFAVFRVIGGEVAQTFSGITSNLQEAFEVISGRATEGLFESLKTAGQDLFKFILDPLTGDISKNVKPIVSDLRGILDVLGKALEAVNRTILGSIQFYNQFGTAIKTVGTLLLLNAARHIPAVLAGLRSLSLQAKEAAASFLGLASAQNAASAGGTTGAASKIPGAIGIAAIVVALGKDLYNFREQSKLSFDTFSQGAAEAALSAQEQAAAIQTLQKALTGVTGENFKQKNATDALVDAYNALPPTMQNFVRQGESAKEQVERLTQAMAKLAEQKREIAAQNSRGFSNAFLVDLDILSKTSDKLEEMRERLRVAANGVTEARTRVAALEQTGFKPIGFTLGGQPFEIERATQIYRSLREQVQELEKDLERQSSALRTSATNFIANAEASGTTASAFLNTQGILGRFLRTTDDVVADLVRLQQRGIDVSGVIQQLGAQAAASANDVLKFAGAVQQAAGAVTPEAFKRIGRIIDETYERAAAKVASGAESRTAALEKTYREIAERERKAASSLQEQSQIPLTFGEAARQLKAYNNELTALNKLTAADRAGSGKAEARKRESLAKALRDAERDATVAAVRDQTRLIEDQVKRELQILEFQYDQAQHLTRDYLAKKKQLQLEAAQAELKETERLRSELLAAEVRETDPVQRVRIRTQINSLNAQEILQLREIHSITVLINQERAKLEKSFPETLQKFVEGLRSGVEKFFQNLEKASERSEKAAERRTRAQQASLDLAEERIRTKVATGVLTEVEARRELNQVYREQIPLLQKAIEEQIRVFSHRPEKNVDDIERLRVELERLKQLLDQPTPKFAFFQGLLGQFRELRDQMKDLGADIKGSIQSAFEDSLTGGSFVDTLINGLKRSFARAAAEQLTQAVLKPFQDLFDRVRKQAQQSASGGTSGGGGVGGFLGGIFGSIGKIFGIDTQSLLKTPGFNPNAASGVAGATAGAASQASIATNTATTATVATQTLSVTTQISAATAQILQVVQQMSGTLTQISGGIDRLAAAQAQCCAAKSEGGGKLGLISGLLGAAATGVSLFNQIGAIPKRAMGGPVKAGGQYVVGENGPELFIPQAHGRIVPNHQLNGGQVVFAPQITVYARDAQSFASRRTQRQIMAEAYAQFMDIQRRGDR